MAALFLSADGVIDEVIQTGDPLGGSVVTRLSIWRQALNDSGQVAFEATLENGVAGIYVATPVPEPSALSIYSLLIISGFGASWWRRSGKRRTVG